MDNELRKQLDQAIELRKQLEMQFLSSSVYQQYVSMANFYEGQISVLKKMIAEIESKPSE